MKQPTRLPIPGNIYVTASNQLAECLKNLSSPSARRRVVRIRYASGSILSTSLPLTPATLRQQRDFWYQSYLYLADNTSLETQP